MRYKTVFPKWIWAVYLILFVLSIPWYLPDKLEMQLVMGLPAWLVACILAICCMALFTSWIIGRYWKEGD